jgi:acyl-CoA synthetase (AMP-forming)/AMP-acid ligase II
VTTLGTAYPGEGPGQGAGQAGQSAYHWLCRHADLTPSAPALTVCHGGEEDERYSFADLLDLANQAAAGLRGQGVCSGDRVLLSLPNDASFHAVLLGCLAVGVIAVPGPVPGISRIGAFRERLVGIVSDSTPRLIVTTTRWAARVAEAVLLSPAAVAVVSWEALRTITAEPQCASSSPNGIAVLQYTSGSTKQPRGVVITHDMLNVNCRQAAAAYDETPADRSVTWVPLYHDMGFVTGLMRPLFTGYESVLLHTETFARSPAAWLRAIDEHRASISSAPNFAYDLCVRKISPEMTADLDLRTWRIARNSGEVIRPETLDRFTARFTGAGLRPETICPSYGMAEATLTVTTCGPGKPALRIPVRSQDLVLGGHIAPVPSATDQSSDPASITVLQSSGVPFPDTHIYVNGGTAERQVGQISVVGPQVMPGYWPQSCPADESAKSPRRVDTNDLGFLYQGHLFVLGRTDDVIVRHGRNYFSSDVTAACSRVPGVRPGRVAVFTTMTASTAPGHEADQVVVAAELSADSDVGAPVLTQREHEIRNELARTLDLHVARVFFLKAGLLPVTTSGKVRTAEVRRRLENGSLPLLDGTPGRSEHSGNGTNHDN